MGCQRRALDCSAMAGWQFDYYAWSDDAGESEEEWAAELAREGWRMWIGPGVWVSIDGRRQRGWPVRRWVERPNAIRGHEGRIWNPPPDDIDEWGRRPPARTTRT